MPKEIEVIKAELDDRHAICRIHKASITIVCGGHYTPEEIAAWVDPKQPDDYIDAIQDEIMLVAKDEGKIVGFAEMTREDPRISAVYVEPQRTRSGIGTRLLAGLEHEVRAAGGDVINLDSTLNAVSFYLSKGFVSRGEGTRNVRSRVSVPCVHMKKRL